MPTGEHDDDLLRLRLAEIADAAGRAARMPAATALRRRRRGRLARRVTAGASILLGVVVAPAAVGADLSPFPVLGGGPGREDARLDPGPPVGALSPPAPASGPVAPGGRSPGGAAPSTEPPGRTPREPAPTATAGSGSASPAAGKGIWLTDRDDRDAAGCARPAWVSRRLDVDYPALQALRDILAGPGPGESGRGLRSAPRTGGLRIRTYRVVDETARVDFEALPAGAALPPRACRAAEILLPMSRTLTQFSHISRVRYSIRGSEAAFYRDLIGIAVPD